MVPQQLNDVSARISLNWYMGLDSSRITKDEGGEKGGEGENGDGEQSLLSLWSSYQIVAVR